MTTTALDHAGVRRLATRAGPRLFAAPADEPRARRATDVLLLVGAVTWLVLASIAAEPSPGFTRAVQRLLAALPNFLSGFWQLLADLLVLLAVLLAIAAIARRRAAIVRDLVVSAVVAVVVWLVLARWVDGAWPAWESLRAAQPPPWYPSPRVALPAAVVMTASPHLTLPIRRLGRWLIGLAMLATVALGATSPLGAVAGMLVATISAAAVHLVFGSSGGRPGLDLVAQALAELGVEPRSLGVTDRQQAGLFVVGATDEHDDPLVVKVYGRDAHDAALLSTLWRTVWFREAGAPLRFGRLQQVEHEAFLTLFARQAGVKTDTVVTAGATAADDALLVLRRHGVPLSDLAEGGDGAAVASDVWSMLGRLHGAGVAHGQLDDQHLLIDGGDVGLIDFRGATVASSETQRRTDEAQALVTTVSVVGEERALSVALDELGGEQVAAMLPYLQPAALTSRQRRQVDGQGIDLDRLRATTAERAGAEPPKLQQLRRMSIGSVLRVALPAVALLLVISAVAGLDHGALLDSLGDATWWLVAVGVIATQVPRLSQAISTLGASPVPLPLGPVYALQLAVSYVNLAIPTTAARVAVNIRFFQRHGVPPGSAMAAGALDGFGGFVVQIGLLLTLVTFTSASLDVDLSGASESAARLGVVVAIVCILAIAVLVVVGRLRRFVMRWGRRLASEARQGLRGIHSPRRLGMLIGGNLVTEVLFAVALGTFVRALGFPVGLGELLLINISTALLSGLVPVPGGVGVAEGALAFGLVRAGLPEETAVAAALLYRASSFYLPPVWGYFALRWLERNGHL
jgi:uncharacterized membrane protein YbhN (UPF0104 family)